MPSSSHFNELMAKSNQLRPAALPKSPFEPNYDFVSQKIQTVELPLGATGFALRDPWEVLSSGYATPEDKARLLGALSRWLYRPYFVLLVGAPEGTSQMLPKPSAFSRVLVQVSDQDKNLKYCVDTSLEVAPFGAIPPEFRSKTALRLLESYSPTEADWWVRVPQTLPFDAVQRVTVDARIGTEGILSAKVKYTMRGDNELLLRVAFHQSPREKWNEVAQLLSLSDGFRGKVEKVSASDPYATKDPFTVEYEITQPKFVDWSKKPVRIPAVLPLVGLPDPPTDQKSPIELGTPLDVQTSVTLHLPPGTTVESPAGTTVDRDYATFSSQYSANANTITASRHIHFISRELPAGRAADYNAFLHAVQNDQAQLFRLNHPDDAPAPSPSKKL